MNRYIAIGQIVKPQGIRGEVKVMPMTDDANRFVGLNEAYIEGTGTDEYVLLRVLSANVRGGFAYVAFDGVADRNAAEGLRGRLIYVERPQAIPLGEGQAFICDIIGCRMVCANGTEIGTITDVIKTGANDVFEVETPRGTLLVPVIPDVVLDMRPEERMVVVDETRLSETSVYAD